MITYRISNAAYSNDISGSGAKRMGARWNSKGVPLLYTAQHISLALLEISALCRIAGDRIRSC